MFSASTRCVKSTILVSETLGCLIFIKKVSEQLLVRVSIEQQRLVLIVVAFNLQFITFTVLAGGKVDKVVIMKTAHSE